MALEEGEVLQGTLRCCHLGGGQGIKANMMAWYCGNCSRKLPVVATVPGSFLLRLPAKG
jgi:hypothetical protein